MQSTLQEPIWGMLTQGTPRGRLEFGMMSLEIQHEASTCNWNSQLKLPQRGYPPSDIAALRLACFGSGRWSTKSPSLLRNSSTALSLSSISF